MLDIWRLYIKVLSLIFPMIPKFLILTLEKCRNNRLENISYIIYGKYTGPIWGHVFSNRLFQHFSMVKIESFFIVGTRRLRTVYIKTSNAQYQTKNDFVVLGAPFDLFWPLVTVLIEHRLMSILYLQTATSHYHKLQGASYQWSYQ